MTDLLLVVRDGPLPRPRSRWAMVPTKPLHQHDHFHAWCDE
jgi:hypothetical protein